MWGGRFAQGPDPQAYSYQSSLAVDWRLYPYDIAGSIAHARMLGHAGIIPPAEAAAIVQGLQDLQAALEAAAASPPPDAEDVHSAIEAMLVERIGPAGQKLHTGRSRNDQVALDMRLYLRDEVRAVDALLAQVQCTLLDIAQKHVTTVMPGYTHLQQAQPVTLAHHLMAYYEMFRRDRGRLAGMLPRINVMPLGSGALAGSTLPLDRDYVARELGFPALSANSMDAVADRDFVVEFIAAAALIMTHVSRLGEELVLWSTREFGFVEIGDAYATGSSLMPHKKNPDLAELMRARAARVTGDLVTVLTMLKGLPLAYNKDLQEDKPALFDAVDTVKSTLAILPSFLSSLSFNEPAMAESAAGDLDQALATDLAEHLVSRGMAFRAAHALVGQVVRYCLAQGRPLTALTEADCRRIPGVDDGTAAALGAWAASLRDDALPGHSNAGAPQDGPVPGSAARTAVARHRTYGGPAPEVVAEAIARARQNTGADCARNRSRRG